MTFPQFTSILTNFTSIQTFKRIFHSNKFSPKTAALMVLRFHVQHNQTAGLESDKIQHGRESKMAIVTKNSRQLNLFFFQNQMVYLAEFCMAHYWDLGFQNNLNENTICNRSRSQSPTFCLRVHFCQNAISQETPKRF